MTHVELVVEIGSSLTEVSFNFTVKGECCFDDRNNLFLDGTLELGEVLAQESVVDGEQRGLLGEGDGKGPEVSLKTGVDVERTGSGVHASGVEGVFDVFKTELVAIIPVLVILVLSQERDGSLSVVRIKSGHVEIINEIDELELANWGISSTCLFLKLLLKDILEEHRVRVEIEIDDLHDVLISCSGEVVEETHSDLGLSAASVTDEHG